MMFEWPSSAKIARMEAERFRMSMLYGLLDFLAEQGFSTVGSDEYCVLVWVGKPFGPRCDRRIIQIYCDLDGWWDIVGVHMERHKVGWCEPFESVERVVRVLMVAGAG